MTPTPGCSEKGQPMETLKKIRVSKEEGMNRRNTGDFQGSETTLYDIIMMDICYYTFVKIHKMYNTKSEL